MLAEDLTERQRRAMMAMLRGMPLEEIARRMKTERNALYKLLHDARVRLKDRLGREGLTAAEVLALFERM
jgi:RNA polymerase sigma-70 factor (ECF subfamily)